MPEPIDIEVNIARQKSSLHAGVEKLGTPSMYACPECHGVLLQLQESGRLRFRCHTGHAYSVQSLLADMDRGIQDGLWDSLRALQEKLLLTQHLADHARKAGDSAAADAWMRLTEDAEGRAGVVRHALRAEKMQAAAAAPQEHRDGEPDP